MDTADTKRRQAESFGAGAAAYARGRPPYPRAAVDWLVPLDARRVVDVGAGTGLFTRSLVERGLDVVAVEPSDGMREQLIAGLPTVTAVAGSAESLPLPDGSVDALFAAQAWHWVDVERASAEAARVLRPGGTLGLVWNIRDESVPWVAALTAVIEPGPEHDAFTEDPPVGAPFHRTERHDVAWTHAMGRDALLDLVQSRSYFLVRSPEQQAAMLDGVRALLDTHPALAGRDVVEMPYVTRCFRTRPR